MSYRNTLLERAAQLKQQTDEPSVLDYLQLRNQQCLRAWQLRRAEYALNSVIRGRAGADQRPRA